MNADDLHADMDAINLQQRLTEHLSQDPMKILNDYNRQVDTTRAEGPTMATTSGICRLTAIRILGFSYCPPYNIIPFIITPKSTELPGMRSLLANRRTGII
ncbi:hypothetical protein OZX74_02550 [Bifidobacterium sp. ESL0798]|uniref:hypothetical protein n=1 Tax=Bifidobacterium sp. ESL0798 TaxID=2983235 RepID=UPI0023F9F57F|nr:hypothetical protein [Bifidobacterium sp. ESL0798]WEV74440.1 hypothetical protein OZX74_02550 [Bifidobacterium sp. ESL0798]